MAAFGTGPGSDPNDDLLIEIPDDARELDADAAAYHRELRRARHRELRDRLLLVQVWRRLGVTAPVAIGALALGVAITALFVAVRSGSTSGPKAEPLATSPAAGTGAIGGLIPDQNVLVGGAAKPIRDLRPAVLALIPLDCGCQSTIENLAAQAAQYGLTVYVVGPSALDAEVDEIAGSVHRGRARSASDPAGALARAYGTGGVTAVLLRSDGVVDAVVRDIGPATTLGPRLAGLDRQ